MFSESSEIISLKSLRNNISTYSSIPKKEVEPKFCSRKKKTTNLHSYC